MVKGKDNQSLDLEKPLAPPVEGEEGSQTVGESEAEKTVEEISVEDVGSVEEVLGDITVDIEEEPEDLRAADEDIFRPLGDEKIRDQCVKVHSALVKISGVKSRRNEGKTNYVAYDVDGVSGMVCWLSLSKKSATLRIAELINGKKHELSVKVKGSVMSINGDRPMTIKNITAMVRKYIKEKKA